MSDSFLKDWLSTDPEVENFFYEESFILEVSEAINSAMESKDISRKELAEEMGKSKSYVTQVLSGSRNMTLRTLAAICKVIQVYPEIRLSDHKKEINRHQSYEDLRGNFDYKMVSPKQRVSKPRAKFVTAHQKAAA